MRRVDERHSTAVHEAGHAVMGWRNNVRLREPGIRLLDGELLGHVAQRLRVVSVAPGMATALAERGGWEPVITCAELDVEIILAGTLAERRFLRIRAPGFLPGAADDYRTALDVLMLIDGQRHGETSEQRVSAWMSMIYARAVRQVREPRTWATIIDVAQALAARGRMTVTGFERRMARLRPPRSPRAHRPGFGC
ncbi:MAG: hypothetical protein HYS27_11770 [Deltaproteobacteria bacterium]|nr:hypothetical protein [Deltaproteobacteria bacterium]